MSRSIARALPALALAMALAACTGSVVSVSQVYSPYAYGYGANDLNYAASRGPIPVDVRGNPYGADAGNHGVVAALQRRVSQPGVQFVASPAPGPGAYRIVLAFGDFLPGINYCAGGVIPTAPGGTGTRIAATVCVGNYLYAQALITGGPTTGPTDPIFDAMMGALASELLQ